ncbi:hypothetical protein HYH03_003868 [Edaphochlamys debaryana]|uniref:Peptidase C1A papain C-terminal domain-containing protein n=1 Tax=Edaphochlamys debaryana TaxID=47281 RepID=A0A835YG51_9CHLO|nr:hypothetical protein HYH03_003868 [Edaphochlamys debaryana]|eukprot:KAG2498110.1 hypothetical protein HYH03_003868 [Edaphochlamys debaryana]
MARCRLHAASAHTPLLRGALVVEATDRDARELAEDAGNTPTPGHPKTPAYGGEGDVTPAERSPDEPPPAPPAKKSAPAESPEDVITFEAPEDAPTGDPILEIVAVGTPIFEQVSVDIPIAVPMPSEEDGFTYEVSSTIPAQTAPVPPKKGGKRRPKKKKPQAKPSPSPPPSPTAYPSPGDLGDESGERQAQVATIPETWDSRLKKLTDNVSIVSSVRFQASCNSCVAFTVMAAAETAYAKATGTSATSLDFSEQHLFFCDAGATPAPPTCREGWTLPEALDVLQASGVYQERCAYYDVTRGSAVCEEAQQRASAGGSTCAPVAGRWEVLSNVWGVAAEADPAVAKALVRDTGSAMTCFRLYDDMYTHRGGVYTVQPESEWLGWHCAQLIGWDDTEGWWNFKSSWGTEIGDKGFFKIAYGEAEVLSWGAYGLIYHPEEP